MAGMRVISKCQKTVQECFQVFSLQKENYTFFFNCRVRYFTIKSQNSDKFDVVIIGGGSGGLSCAREAKALNASVCVIDYVSPSPRGTTWGLGGTCVNVGCIPKKLMHESALLKDAIHDAAAYGWKIKDLDKITIDWNKLREGVQDQIKSVNWVTRVSLRENKIEYLNGAGKFIDSHTIEVNVKDGIRKIYGENIVIAIGGRPAYPNIPGALDFGLTSDDIFNLPHPPGKTLIVGAGYIAVEFAGFLNAFQYPVTVMIRSIVLRNFDRQMVNFLTDNLIEKGIKLLYKTIPKEVKKRGEIFTVTYENLETKEVKKENFDTVVFAIGRKALTKDLNTNAINLKLDKKSCKLITNKDESTNIPHIYAVGDVAYGRPELSPSAIKAGLLLARRIFGKSNEIMDYDNIATTIFSPLEYGCVGLSEEKAVEKFGMDNLEIYHTFYKPPEFFIPQKPAEQCYIKVICEREKPEKVLGMHFLGPKAGEVIQGYAAAMQCNFTMEQLQETVGIHPTISEEFTRLFITKRSGLDPLPQSCCS